MDFRSANERAQAERDRRLREFRGTLSPQDRRRFWFKLVIFSIGAVLVAILASHGIGWAVPAYFGAVVISLTYELFRRRRRVDGL